MQAKVLHLSNCELRADALKCLLSGEPLCAMLKILHAIQIYSISPTLNQASPLNEG